MFRDLITSLLITLFLCGARLPAVPEQTTQNTALPILTVCEALSHASEYDGKIVRIRDTTFGTDEFSAFRSDLCPGVLVTDGKVWPSSIVWTMPSDSEMILHPVNFIFDSESQQVLQKKWQELSKHLPNKCIAVMYTGMFEVWSRSKSRKTIPGGWKEFSGFGHLNGWGAQLVLKSADDVAPIPNCQPKK